MGYLLHSLVKILDMIETGVLARDASFLDFGSQDVFLFSSGEREQLLAAMRRSGADEAKLTAIGHAASPFPATLFFEALGGLRYEFSDVDGRDGSIYVDLNDGVCNAALRGRYDVVSNQGTTEHLSNLSAALFVMHHVTKCGGLMWHHNPVAGFSNHSFINVTPKFWQAAISVNRYELIAANVYPFDVGAVDVGNIMQPSFAAIEGHQFFLSSPSAMMQYLIRKREDRIFFPPLDFYDWSSRITAGMIADSLMQFERSGMIEFDEMLTSLNDHYIRGGSRWWAWREASTQRISLISRDEPASGPWRALNENAFDSAAHLALADDAARAGQTSLERSHRIMAAMSNNRERSDYLVAKETAIQTMSAPAEPAAAAQAPPHQRGKLSARRLLGW